MAPALKIKICGVRTRTAAAAAERAGADFAGLNFVPSSRRAIDRARARAVRAALGEVTPVGVFLDQPLPFIEEIAHEIGIDWLQLHGSEPPACCRLLEEKGFRVIKAIRISGAIAAGAIETYRPHVSAFLFDGPTPGSGRTFGWSLLASIAIDLPFFVAGGLTPENVAEAVSAVELVPSTAPWRGVDTASGVEVAGEQDPERIRAFVARARSS